MLSILNLQCSFIVTKRQWHKRTKQIGKGIDAPKGARTHEPASHLRTNSLLSQRL